MGRLRIRHKTFKFYIIQTLETCLFKLIEEADYGHRTQLNNLYCLTAHTSDSMVLETKQFCIAQILSETLFEEIAIYY